MSRESRVLGPAAATATTTTLTTAICIRDAPSLVSAAALIPAVSECGSGSSSRGSPVALAGKAKGKSRLALIARFEHEGDRGEQCGNCNAEAEEEHRAEGGVHAETESSAAAAAANVTSNGATWSTTTTNAFQKVFRWC